MGQNNSNFELASEARRAAERFDECEIKVIKETFKDLCQINGGSTRIDKETFLQYLPLPGLLGERLFAVFDRKNSGEIDYEEFVCGLAVTCRGSWEEKVEFIFNLYDIHGQGAVNREELAALLNHVPKSIMRFGRAVTFETADPHLQHCRLHRHQHNRGNRRLPPLPHPQQQHHHHQSQQQHEQHQQQHRNHPPPPPSTAGTPPSALSGHSSPVMSTSSANAVGGTTTAGAADTEGVPLSGVASASEGDGERGVPVGTNSAEDGGVVAAGAGDGSSSSPPLTSGNLMQLQLASISPTASAMSAPSVMTAPSVGAAAEVPPGGGGGGVVGVAGDVVGVETGDVLEGGAGAVRTAGDGGGRAAAASGGSMVGEDGIASGGGFGGSHVGGGGKCRRRGRRDTPRSEGSGEDLSYGAGTASANSYAAHWEHFTNNDIVEQAFEDCDLNHNGKLSFSEFRLWVERNPIVTQFLQSVFPYDEHREWGDDRKHLPFIHNREFTGSPMLSDAGGSPGDVDSSEEEARRLLIKARNTTRDPSLQEGISRLLDQHEGTFCGEEAVSKASAASSAANGNPPLLEGPITRRRSGGNSSLLGAAPAWLLNELSPRSAKALQHQTVAKQGFLWKQGHRFRTWKQRWYVLVGNCIYYYQQEDDVYPCGVMFLTGSFVEPLQEGHNERKGFWGIEISRNNETNHRRRLYTRSKVEQLKWVKELRKASAVVPIEDDFEIGEELGKGRFSRVCMCVNKHTLERKAVKIIMKEDMKAEEKDLLRAEIAIMKLVNHPNIIRMEAVYESKKDIFIVMELHSGGELFDRIVGRPRFSEDEAFTVIHPLVESVAYLHEMGIVHRDLKPENILCGNRIGDIKIADFGLSKMVMPDEIMKMPCGTLTYVAPEVLTLNGYGKEADIWSVGTIMYLLIRGRLPFDGSTREEIIENTIHGTIAWENDHVWAGFSDDCKDLVLGMLNKDVTQRYKAKDVLRHPWITSRERRQEEHPEEFVF